MTLRVRTFVFLTAAAALLCMLAATWGIPATDSQRMWNAVAAFAVLGFFAEASYLRLRVGSGETNASQLASLLLLDTGWVLAIAALAELGVEYAVRKKPPLKIIFNVSQLVVALYLASWLYHSLGGTSSLSLADFRLAPVRTDPAPGRLLL